jgi:hypothetical protein
MPDYSDAGFCLLCSSGGCSTVAQLCQVCPPTPSPGYAAAALCLPAYDPQGPPLPTPAPPLPTPPPPPAGWQGDNQGPMGPWQ